MTDEATARIRGPYRKGVQRREQIVRSASDVFGELGYIGGSLRTIADRVGASPATIIQYFGSKEGLLTAVLEDWQVQSGQWLLADDPSGLEYLRALIRVTEFHVEHRGLLELFITMAAEATNPGHPAREFIQNRYADVLANCTAKLREAVDRREVAPMSDEQIEAEIRILIAVLDGIELQWLLGADIDLPALTNQHLEQAITRWKAGPPLS